MNKEVLIYIELFENKVLNVSKEIVSKSRKSFENFDINGVIITDKKTRNLATEELKSLNLNKIYVLSDDILDNFNTCIYSNVLATFLNDKKPDIFLMGATPEGRDLAPRTASKLNIGLTADCTELSVDEDGNLLATRPTYGGKLMATIISKTKPNFATIRPGAFKNDNKSSENIPEIIEYEQNLEGVNCLIEVLNCAKKVVQEDWTCSDVIIAGGLGLKSKENFDLLCKLADVCNAKPAASRAVVEIGWADSSIQVGQTGYSVSPKLYIAFGISGAMQHLAGVTNADKIIAINTDKYAPIVQSSDIAIISDAESVIKSLLDKIC